MPAWFSFVGWGLTCLSLGLTVGLTLRKERKEAAAAKATAETAAKAEVTRRLLELEQDVAEGAAEREALTNVLDKMGNLHEQVIVVVAGQAHTRREIDDLKTSVLDIRQELRLIRSPHALTAAR